MFKHFDIMIISHIKLNEKLLENYNYFIFTEDITLDDYFSFRYNNETYSYDALIFSDPSTVRNLDILSDGDFIVTNVNLETSFESIFALGEINKSKLSINEQLNIILSKIN